MERKGSSGTAGEFSDQRHKEPWRSTGGGCGTTKALTCVTLVGREGSAIAAGFVTVDVARHVVLNTAETAAETVGKLMPRAPQPRLQVFSVTPSFLAASPVE